jgi:hypothetical protein
MSWSSREEGGEFVVKIDLEQEPGGAPFRLGLPVEIRGSGDERAVHATVELVGAAQSFEIRAPFRPTSVKLDPEQRMPIEVRVTGGG